MYKKILNQSRKDKNKVYSIHEPDVQCISKGKEHKKYEFGNKVSIVYTQSTGVIVGALGFRNPYDGHTLQQVLDQSEKLLGKASIKTATTDRGYRGVAKVNDIDIYTPKKFNPKNLTTYQQNKLKKQFKKRAAIEPAIGHLKTDYRLNRNFYKGIMGDNINIMLVATAYNIKRMMNKWKSSFLSIFYSFFIEPFFYFDINFLLLKIKMTF